MKFSEIRYGPFPIFLVKSTPDQPDVVIKILSVSECERGQNIIMQFPSHPQNGMYDLLTNVIHKNTDVTVGVSPEGEVIWPRGWRHTFRELTDEERDEMPEDAQTRRERERQEERERYRSRRWYDW